MDKSARIEALKLAIRESEANQNRCIDEVNLYMLSKDFSKVERAATQLHDLDRHINSLIDEIRHLHLEIEYEIKEVL